MLEPRIVLNATAALFDSGDLVITGDSAVGDPADDLDVRLDLSGNLSIWDSGVLVPIYTGTDASGNPVYANSLDPSLITSGRLIANLGAGDDSLQVDVPVGLDITANGGAGDDSLTILLNADGSGVSDNTLVLAGETILIDGGGDDIDLNTSTLVSAGTGGLITIDDASSLLLGQIDVSEGTLQIGDVGTPLSGAISQAAGTSITAPLVSVYAGSDVDISNSGNSIDDLTVFLGSGVPGSTLNLVAGDIHIDGGGSDVDLGTSTLTSDITGGLITIDDASSLLLGQIDVSEGTLQIGDVGTPLSGAISQAAGTSITVPLVSVYAGSDVDISNSGNSIDDLTVFLGSGAPGSTLNLVAGDIHIDGGGSDVDLGISTLTSDITGGLITINDGSSLLLGQIDVSEGTLQIGDVGTPLSGAISQAAGTSITVPLVSVYAGSDVDISNGGNSIDDMTVFLGSGVPGSS